MFPFNVSPRRLEFFLVSFSSLMVFVSSFWFFRALVDAIHFSGWLALFAFVCIEINAVTLYGSARRYIEQPPNEFWRVVGTDDPRVPVVALWHACTLFGQTIAHEGELHKYRRCAACGERTDGPLKVTERRAVRAEEPFEPNVRYARKTVTLSKEEAKDLVKP